MPEMEHNGGLSFEVCTQPPAGNMTNCTTERERTDVWRESCRERPRKKEGARKEMERGETEKVKT